jgi:hypothetical protein
MPDGLGTNPGATYWPLPGTAKLDWGLSQLNLNDSFTASILYDLPFGKGKHFGNRLERPDQCRLGKLAGGRNRKSDFRVPLVVVDSADESGTCFSPITATPIRVPTRSATHMWLVRSLRTNTRCQYLPPQTDPVTNLPGIAPPADPHAIRLVQRLCFCSGTHPESSAQRPARRSTVRVS